MRLEIAARVRRLFRADADTAELVAFANAYTAVGVGLCALLHWELSFLPTALVTLATFLLLCLCLLFRPTMAIAVLVGGSAALVGPALVLAALGFRLARFAGWVGALVGLGVGLRFASRFVKLRTLSGFRVPRDELTRAHAKDQRDA